MAVLFGTAAAAVMAELYGVYGPRPMDCWTEVWRWSFQRRSRRQQVLIAGGLAALLGRLWYHLILEEPPDVRRHRRRP